LRAQQHPRRSIRVKGDPRLTLTLTLTLTHPKSSDPNSPDPSQPFVLFYYRVPTLIGKKCGSKEDCERSPTLHSPLTLTHLYSFTIEKLGSGYPRLTKYRLPHPNSSDPNSQTLILSPTLVVQLGHRGLERPSSDQI